MGTVHWIALQIQRSMPGVASTSIAESQLGDRAWFYIELATYLKTTFFNQYFREYVKLKNVAFYDIMHLW